MSQSNEWQGVLRGILLLMGLHLAAIVIGGAIYLVIYGLVTTFPAIKPLYVINLVLLWSLFGIGVFQFAYVIPTIVILNRDRRYALMKGVIIGAVFTALLNAACFAWLLSVGI